MILSIWNPSCVCVHWPDINCYMVYKDARIESKYTHTHIKYLYAIWKMITLNDAVDVCVQNHTE